MTERLAAGAAVAFAAAVGVAVAIWVIHVLATAPDAASAVVALSFTAVGLFIALVILSFVLRVLGLGVLAIFGIGKAFKRALDH